jgi:hypothetical protein
MTIAMRMAIADMIVNGRNYEDIRDYLVSAGVVEAELPSDFSLRTFQESAEFQAVYNQRQTACDLKFTAGMVAGCVDARVAILQNRTLEILELWLDNGVTEPADIYKILNFTLHFQKQAMISRKTRRQMGERELPETLGPRELSAKRLNELVESEMTARLATQAAAAEEAEAAASPVEGEEGSARIVKDNAGLSSIVEAEAAIDEDPVDALVAELAMAVGAEYGPAKAAASPPRPAFRNTPSAATRAKARKRRKKR